MFHEFLSSVVDNREISVRDHHALFQLANVIDAHGRRFEVFPKGKTNRQIRIEYIVKSKTRHEVEEEEEMTESFLLRRMHRSTPF